MYVFVSYAELYAMYVIPHFEYLIWSQHYMLAQIIDFFIIALYSSGCLEQSIFPHFMLIDIPPHPARERF